MMIKVLHKCGHEYEHNYKSKPANLTAWLFKASDEDCPNCMYLKLAREAEDKKLPVLLGSVEQQVWAMTIRNEIMLKYNMIKKEFNKKSITKERRSELFLAILKIKDCLCTQKESAFWIKHKSIRGLLKFRKVKVIPKKKPIEQIDYKMNFDDEALFDMFEGRYDNRLQGDLSYLC